MPARISLLDLALAFAQIGFSSVGGAAGPIRHGIVVQRRWLDETQFSEMFGVCQALPGATGGNVAIAIGQRFGGLPGAAVALASFTLPTMVFAIALAAVAIHLAATNARLGNAEATIAAGAAGLFAANGARVGWILWRAGEGNPRFRLARAAISLLGVALVVGLHLWVPAAVVILIALGLLVDAHRGDVKAR